MQDPTLSKREKEVLDLAAEGLIDANVAQRLGISEATVATYWARIRAKLNASSRTEAVAIHLHEEMEFSQAKFESEFSEVKAELDRFRGANEEAELLHSVFENLPEAVLVVNNNLEIVLANQAAAALFGYAENRIVPLSVNQLVPKRLRQAHREHVAEFHETPVAHRMGPHQGVPALHRSGKEFVIVGDLVPIRHCGEQMTLFMIREVASDSGSDSKN